MVPLKEYEEIFVSSKEDEGETAVATLSCHRVNLGLIGQLPSTVELTLKTMVAKDLNDKIAFEALCEFPVCATCRASVQCPTVRGIPLEWVGGRLEVVQGDRLKAALAHLLNECLQKVCLWTSPPFRLEF